MSHTVEILSVGTELLLGNIVNTDAQMLSQGLSALGLNVYYHTVVGDNPQRVRRAVDIARQRADIIITTGGLGPTCDDLTKNVLAQAFGKKLVYDEESARRIRSHFVRTGRPITENIFQQAMLPEGCTIFANDWGTAPGCAFQADGVHVIMLPGPPREMKPMFDHWAVPILTTDSEYTLVSKNLYFFGIGESTLESRLKDLMVNSRNPTVAPYAKTGEVMLRVTARVHRPEEAEGVMAPALKIIEETAGEYLYGIDVGNLQTAAVRILREKGLHAAAAESCTGGLVAKRLTAVRGASAVFECGVCTYSNRMKAQILHVKEETLQKFSAVSPEVAAEMAEGVCALSGADIGVSVTGNAGPEPSEGKPVGMVFVGAHSKNYKAVIPLNIRRTDEDAREYIRYLASSQALYQIIEASKRF